MHDLNEGVVPAVLELILSSFAKKNSFCSELNSRTKSQTRALIEASFSNFNFSEGCPTLRWISKSSKGKTKKTATSFKIEGKAIEVCTDQNDETIFNSNLFIRKWRPF